MANQMVFAELLQITHSMEPDLGLGSAKKKTGKYLDHYFDIAQWQTTCLP
tara:strand:- start:55 stop:204 length:150 start_codon:yes stop_codon:yes gene_type:complete